MAPDQGVPYVIFDHLMSAEVDTKPVAVDSATQPEAEKPRKVYGNNASANFLADLRGEKVVVKQPSGIEYRGVLHAVDGFLNVVLRDTTEVYQGNVLTALGEVFLRGSSVDYIAAA